MAVVINEFEVVPAAPAPNKTPSLKGGEGKSSPSETTFAAWLNSR